MFKNKKIILSFILIFFSSIFFTSCNKKNDKPISLTMWHVYGEQATSPMDELVDEFNDSVGKKEGIVINVTASSNSAEIGDALLDSQAHNSGSKKMPDLFFCHKGNAEDLGVENLVDWNKYFSKDELDKYVPDFLEDGKVGKKLVVFPFSKSTHLLFVNGSVFDRFSKDTGVSYDDLKTWEGFFDVSEKFYKWSKGKPFCAFDYYLREIELSYLSNNPEKNLHNEVGWYDFDNIGFKNEFDKFSSSLVRGNIIISDLYANTQMMTGETFAGISSSAAILYYNDTVTYPDNTSEPMNLKVLPLPKAKSGKKFDTLAGTGLCAYKTSEKKAEAAAVFAKWITQKEQNLKFVSEAGYMPVRKDAFDALSKYKFKDNSYKELYDVLFEMRKDYKFLPETYNYDKVLNFYDQLRERQNIWKARYEKGEDEKVLVDECWQILKK